MKWKILKDKYVLVKLNLKQLDNLNFKDFQKKFFSIIYEKDEITLIINQNNWNKIKKNFKKAEIENNFRILTYDQILDWNITGFIAKVGEILAKNRRYNILNSHSFLEFIGQS